MRNRLFIAPLAVAALALVAAGCGGDDDSGASSATAGTTTAAATTETSTAPETGEFLPGLPDPELDDDNRPPRNSSVGDGIGGAPQIAATVRSAATAAGCTARGFASEGREHVQPSDEPDYATLPPTSGNHFEIPAKFGAYDQPVPEMLQVHALEHGAIIIHVGAEVPSAQRTAIGELWAQSPPYMIVQPGRSKDFPPKGVVVTSWQRWIVCKPYTPEALEAITVFRDTYRGTGPEGLAALHASDDIPLDGVPEPISEDRGARIR